MGNELKMDLIKGLSNGFCYMDVTGSKKHRDKVYKNKYKEYVKKRLFHRNIEVAPRDKRYRIDYYVKTSVDDSLCYKTSVQAFYGLLKYLNIDETFNWAARLKWTKSEYTYNDITIGYNSIDNYKTGYYFKYKDKINTLYFKNSYELVDYSEDYWKRKKDEPRYHRTLHEMISTLSMFLAFHKIY